MNVHDTLQSGHDAVMQALQGISDDDYEIHHVTGSWTLKDVVGHLAAHEHLLDNILMSRLLANSPIPYHEEYRLMGNKKYNQYYHDQYKVTPHSEILSDLTSTHQHIMSMLWQVTPDLMQEKGLFSWWEPEKTVEDFIFERNYHHKLHHAKQIEKFKQYLEELKHKPSKKAG